MIPAGADRARQPAARPTLEMVASRAGVSRGTASRALNGGLNVSAKALAAVQAAADELGYRPNLAARSLVLGRSESVGLVVSETDERLFGDPFFAAVVRGAHRELSSAGIQLVLALAQSDEERAQMARFAGGRHLDGVLLISLHASDPLPWALSDAGIPVVMAGRPEADVEASGAWWVDADNRGGARSAVEHLIGRGRSRIATVAGPEDMSVGRDRLQGWRDALGAAGLPATDDLVAGADFSLSGGSDAMRRLLAAVPDLDAVFAGSDLMAIGALEALREAGRRVPEDVAVVGFDDIPAARTTRPPLTTVQQPIEEMGRAMARMLVERVNGEEPEQPCLVLPTRLVERASA